VGDVCEKSKQDSISLRALIDLQHEQRLLSVWGHEIDPKTIETVFETCGFEAKLSDTQI